MGNKESKPSANVQEVESETVDAPSQEQQMSYYQMAKAGYQQLVNAIIRPPRCEYDESFLGPVEFEFCGREFTRRDFNIRNARDMKICCSMWEPSAADRPNAQLPCVIYMHGNSSARPEALTILSMVLSIGATLFTFDFCGSGLSDGEYVSLGVYEKDDLQAVIEHLRNEGNTSYIALWGRSMGAGSALLHGERDPSIAAMVLDSCYSDLTALAEEMVEKGRQNGLFAPGMIVRLALSFIRSTIQKTANFDIKDVSPIKGANRCFIPAMFVSARGDDFVTPSHSKSICEVYGGDKNLVMVDGDHNSNRPKFMFTSAAIFLTNTLMLPEGWGLRGASKYLGGLRPWDFLGQQQSRPVGSSAQSDIRNMLVGMEEDDAALERALALSLVENANAKSQEAVAPSATSGNAVPVNLDTSADISVTAPGVQLGMTGERQEHLRQALYTMFGGAPASCAKPGDKATEEEAPPGDSQSQRTGDKPNGVDDEAKLTATIHEPSAFSSPVVSEYVAAGCDVLNSVDDNEHAIGFSCSACTLLNSPNERFCVACNTPLFV